MASPMMFDRLRLKNIFDPNTMMGNDLPSQGGIMGNMGFPEGFGPTPAPPPLFNPAPVDVTPPGVSLSQPMPAMSPSERIAQEAARLYTPETAASQRFNELLGQYPSQEDYHPSMLRRIGSALTAVGGSFDRKGGFQFNPHSMEAGMQLLNEPYSKKINDWKNQVGPAYQAATLERQSNVNERTAAYQTVAQQLRAEADDERAKNNDRNAAIRQQRADAYEFKIRNPGLKFQFPKGGNVIALDPASGKAVEVTDSLGKPIPTGTMTDSDKMQLEQENAIGRIQEQGAQARQTEGVKQEGRTELAWSDPYEITLPDGTKKYMQTNRASGDIREAKFPAGSSVTRKVGTSAGGAGGKGELPTQTRVRQFNAARELYNTRPDLRPFIKLGTPGANDFSVVQPGTGFWGSPTGPTPEQAAELQQKIYGQGEIPINQPTRTGKMPTPGVPQNTPEGSPNRPPVSNSQNPAPKDTGAKYTPPNNMPQGNILRRTQTNAKTGAKRVLISIDGGKTWSVQGASATQ